MPTRTLTGVALIALAAITWGRPASGQSGKPAAAASAPAAPSAPPAPLSPNASPSPFVLPSPQPVPSPITSLPPASSASALPYPAYGTPVPGVDRGVPGTNVPQIVSLEQAIAIGFARSPLLAQARAVVLIDTAPVDLAKTAILPNLRGTANVDRVFRQPGSTSLFNTGTGGTGTGTGTGGTGTGTGGTGTGTGSGGTGTGSGGTGTGSGGTGTGTGTGSGGTGTGTGTGTTTGTSSSQLTFGSAYSTAGFSLALTQLIYDGGRVAAQYHEAKATQSASIATYKRQLQTVAYNVSNAYYAALSAQRVTQVATETVKINQVNANLVAAQIRAGTAARSDYLTAELPVAQARVALVRDQGTELSAQAAFVNAMGLDANTYVLPQDDGNVLSGASGTPLVTTPSYDTAIARAYMLRPDYFSAQQSVQSFQYAVRAARLGLFPNINASASYGTDSSDPLAGNFRNSGSVGLSLTVPIFDQGITHAQVEQAQGQLDQSVAALNVTQQSVQLNVKQTLVALISARAAFDQTQAELANARQVLQATQAQYAAGVTTLPLLLNAQVGLTQALADQVAAVYALRQAEAAFLYAEGANAPA